MNSVMQEHHDRMCTLAQSAWQLTLHVKTLWVVMSFHGEDSFSLAAQNQITRQGIPDGISQRDESRRGASRHLEDRQVTSLTRKADCDEESAKAN